MMFALLRVAGETLQLVRELPEDRARVKDAAT